MYLILFRGVLGLIYLLPLRLNYMDILCLLEFLCSENLKQK
jgi:hypothetical protein